MKEAKDKKDLYDQARDQLRQNYTAKPRPASWASTCRSR